jgi:putative methionine-R-sulfoxide reductase with GAF domain
LRTSASGLVEEEIVPEENKPIRDEQTLARVLEAAYVLQEHNREQRNKKADPKLSRNQLIAEQTAISSVSVPQTLSKPNPDSAKLGSGFTLAQIVEVQHQIQVRHLELENVMSLVLERLIRFAGASGAAIGIVDGKKVHYRAAVGPMATPAGTEIPLEEALCADCLRTGNILNCADVDTEVRVNQNECRDRGIRAVLAIPVFNDGIVAGSLELYFTRTQAFTEEEVHTCQLMAGLVSEALARNEKVSWKKSLAAERSVMLEALEKLKPNLAALADMAAVKNVAAVAGDPAMTGSASTFACRACGHELVGQEQFCGNCGSPRNGSHEAPNMQSTIATLWHLQEAMKTSPRAESGNGAVVHEESKANLDQVHDGDACADSTEEQSPERFSAVEPRRHETTESKEVLEAPVGADLENAAHSDLEIPLHTIPESDVEAPQPTALVKPERSAAWSSAATTLDFFQQLARAKDRGVWAEFWNTRRGDIYLAIAVVLLLGAIRWGIWSNHSVSAKGNPTVSAGHRKAAPDADLSLFDRILVKLGLAEAPDPPEYKGNPATQVWVDLQTALYYCPGADLYGKTPKGKFSPQRTARLDQFEPAYRKACD